MSLITLAMTLVGACTIPPHAPDARVTMPSASLHLLVIDSHRLSIALPLHAQVQRVATLRLTTAGGREYWSPLDLATGTTAALDLHDTIQSTPGSMAVDLDDLHWLPSISSTWPGAGRRGLPPDPRSINVAVEVRSAEPWRWEANATLPRPCARRDYTCFMANVESLGEHLPRAEVERRLGPPSGVIGSDPGESWRDTILAWHLDALDEQRPESPPAYRVEVSLAHGRVVHVRIIGFLER